MWIDALESRVNLTLVTSPCNCGTVDPRIRIVRAERSARAGAHALFRVWQHGLPRHALLTSPYRWKAAIARAGSATHFDAAVVLLTRTDPWVRASVSAPTLILDAIDSAAAGMEERSREASLLRTFWKRESRRATAIERGLSDDYSRVIVVSESEADRFVPQAETIGMGVALQPLDRERERRFDFGFFGRLEYFANRDSVKRLTTSLWPLIRKQRPDATLFIGGAEAPREIRDLDGSDGIHVLSPVPDSGEAWRDVRVALLPLNFGSGQSMKTVEAAEAGCAIAGTSCAFRALPDLASIAVVEDDDRVLAQRAVALLDDATHQGLQLRASVERNHARGPLLDRMAQLVMHGSL
jgi:glycosyltransferase involved in cell wall biosynthesis